MMFGKWIFLAIVTSSSLASAQSSKPIVGWRYIPVFSDSWRAVTGRLEEGKFESAFENALDISKVAKQDAEIHEGHLALAKSLGALGYPQVAFHLLTSIVDQAPNSYAANEALLELDKISQQQPVDEEYLARVISRAAPTEVPEAAMSMTGYYLLTDHLAAGQLQWVKNFTTMLKAGTFWSDRLEYFNSLELLKDGQVEPATVKLQGLLAKGELNPLLKLKVELQLARIYFEKSDYPSAEKIYAGLRLAERSSGRVLYERAWNQYYLKDYSVALGMLESLKAPYFNPAVEPEQYVLNSLILRDLCHYPEVKKASVQFFQVFNPVLKHIRDNKPLEKNSTLMSMALIQDPIRSLADVVDAIQKERTRLQAERGSHRTIKEVLKQLASRELELKGRLSRRLHDPLRAQAQRLLEIADQIKLLDYVSGLDENRIQTVFENRGYKSEKPDTLRFDTLFWPLRKPSSLKSQPEYWFDEHSALKVLISDRCQGAK